MKLRSPQEIERLLRNQVWHYRRDMRTDWDEGGCEWQRLQDKGSRSVEEE